MKALAALLPLVLVSASPVAGVVYSGTPPVQYWGQGAAFTVYANDVNEFCPVAVRPGAVLLGCHYERDGLSIIVLPNPCVLAKTELFARLACHEKGHLNGWPGDHPL
tara:strand:+ start:8803 stop:9123 length:321 start_codon:yes stop_codon:yes gene_type:complete